MSNHNNTAVAPDELVPMGEIKPDPELVEAVQRKHRLTPFTKVLLGLVVAMVVFIAGIRVERHSAESNKSATTGLPAGLADLLGANRGAAPAAAGGSGSSTVGTVKLVDGNNVYVSDFQGNVVKVKTDSSTVIKVSTQGSIEQLKPGTSVVVQGTKAKDSSVAATSVAESQGAGAGGFPNLAGAVPEASTSN